MKCGNIATTSTDIATHGAGERSGDVDTTFARLAEQLDRLRALYTLLASERDHLRQDELLERTRIAIADVPVTARSSAVAAGVGDGADEALHAGGRDGHDGFG